MMPALCARCGREFAEGVSACPRCGWAPAEPAHAAPVTPVPAPAAPPKPRLSAEEREAATEALKPLKALQAATATGLKYAEYEARALETKSRVEPLLQTRNGDTEIMRYVREALDIYLLALSTWARGARKEWAAILADPRIDLCAAGRISTIEGVLGEK